MKFRLHPILLPLFLFLLISGNLPIYTFIFISLLIHELGHLIAARATGMHVRSCTIMPYGGELVIPGRYTARRKNRILVALGGPGATILLLIFSLLIPFPGAELFLRIQIALLGLNLLPVLPLDGGQVLSALLESKGTEHSTRVAMLVYSIVFFSVTLAALLLSLPATIAYVLLILFLLIQNITAFRFRKYEKAFINLKLNRLTK